MRSTKKFLPILLLVIGTIVLFSVALWREKEGTVGHADRRTGSDAKMSDGSANRETGSDAGTSDNSVNTETGNSTGVPDTATAALKVKLENPRTGESGGKMTWDCVWFGSYPQAEIVTEEKKEKASAKKGACLQEGDLLADDAVYASLEDADYWDANGEITVDGAKYRRIQEKDATSAGAHRGFSNSGRYDWSDDALYHYFKYEPVKWRVLSTDGKQALLLSDRILDDQKYNMDYDDITWETGTVRSWLNGYDASSNAQGIDYSSNNFLDSAFTDEEQAVIVDTTVVNNGSYWDDLAEAGRDTHDKLFLLSELDVFGEEAVQYGFAADEIVEDGARFARNSTYAKAMGALWNKSKKYAGNGEWWLRTHTDGDFDDDGGDWGVGAVYVMEWGEVDDFGSDVDADRGVRVALNLELSSNPASESYTYAGTVSSDGVATEVEPGAKAVSGARS